MRNENLCDLVDTLDLPPEEVDLTADEEEGRERNRRVE